MLHGIEQNQPGVIRSRLIQRDKLPMCGLRSSSKVGVLVAVACLTVASCSPDKAASDATSAAVQPLILYSSLPEERVRVITAAYTEASGVAMHYMLDSPAVLIDKLVTKAHRPSADVLLIADVGQLAVAVEADVLRPTRAASIEANIPVALRDPDNYWFGLSLRAITIAYDTRSVDPAKPGGYPSLGDGAWFGGVWGVVCVMGWWATCRRLRCSPPPRSR